jgi:uncharacterized protein (TIGR03086 family)
MTNVVSIFRRAQDEFTKRVNRVGTDQWRAPTPDDEWTVSELVGHLVNEHLWVPPLLDGHRLDEAAKIVEGAERTFADQPVQGWEAAALGSLRAVTEPGALEREVELSRGSTPVPEYLNEMIVDLAVHSWDLGVAIDLRDPLPDDVVERALRRVTAMGDLSWSGLFKPPVDVPAGASDEDRLMALTGRDPRRPIA